MSIDHDERLARLAQFIREHVSVYEGACGRNVFLQFGLQQLRDDHLKDFPELGYLNWGEQTMLRIDPAKPKEEQVEEVVRRFIYEWWPLAQEKYKQ